MTTNDQKTKVLIYLPALNEEENIGKVIGSIPTKTESKYQLSILVVDDGSNDKTKEIALKKGASVVSHPVNRGLGSCFRTAIDYALSNSKDVMVSIDADGQFNTDEIFSLIEPIVTGDADFATGCRFHENEKPEAMPSLKYWGNKRVNSIVSWVVGQEIKDASCGFRAYSRESLLRLNLIGEFTYTHETLIDLLFKNFRLAQVPISVEYFPDRVSRIAHDVWNYAKQSLLIIIRSLRDYRPLFFFAIIASFFLAISILLGSFVAAHWFYTGQISPYKSIGILSLGALFATLGFGLTGLVSDMFSRVRISQERQLFLLRKIYYND